MGDPGRMLQRAVRAADVTFVFWDALGLGGEGRSGQSPDRIVQWTIRRPERVIRKDRAGR